jgi:hypothetical protein
MKLSQRPTECPPFDMDAYARACLNESQSYVPPCLVTMPETPQFDRPAACRALLRALLITV